MNPPNVKKLWGLISTMSNMSGDKRTLTPSMLMETQLFHSWVSSSFLKYSLSFCTITVMGTWLFSAYTYFVKFIPMDAGIWNMNLHPCLTEKLHLHSSFVHFILIPHDDQVKKWFKFSPSCFFSYPPVLNISSSNVSGFRLLFRALLGLWKIQSSASTCKQLFHCNRCSSWQAI